MRIRNRVASLAVVCLLTISALPLSVDAAPSGRATLNGSVPKWANTTNYVGAVDASSGVGFRVYLGWNSASAAEAVAAAVSDPRGASYGQFLSPAAFRRQFAPSQAQVGAVQS